MGLDTATKCLEPWMRAPYFEMARALCLRLSLEVDWRLLQRLYRIHSRRAARRQVAGQEGYAEKRQGCEYKRCQIARTHFVEHARHQFGQQQRDCQTNGDSHSRQHQPLAHHQAKDIRAFRPKGATLAESSENALGRRFNLIFIVNRGLTTPAREISATYRPFNLMGPRRSE